MISEVIGMGGQGGGEKCLSEDGWTVSWMISEVIGMGGQGGGREMSQ